MTPFPPPRFQNLPVGKDHEIVPIGLTVYDQGTEGTSVDLHFVPLMAFSLFITNAYINV